MKRVATAAARLLRIGLRLRIYLGFGVLIALLLGIAAYGSYGLSAVGEEIDKMDGIAGNANRLGDLALRMETIRRGVADYGIDQDASALRDVADAEAHALTVLRDSAANTLSEQRRAMFNGVVDKLQAFEAGRRRLVGLRDTAVAERARAFAAADRLRDAMRALAAAADGDAGEAGTVTAARLALLATEGAGLRLLAAPDAALLPAFRQDAASAAQAISALGGLASPAIKPGVAPVEAALAQFVAAVNGSAGARLQASSMYATEIRPALRDMQETTGKLLAKMIKGFTATSEKAAAAAADTLTMQLGLSGAATVIGILIAFLIARGIIRPVHGMTAVMTVLANGRTDCQVPDRDKTDEIGEMARAVEVFRLQAIEGNRLAAAQQQDQAAKDRRQQTMDGHTSDFGNSITGVMTTFAAAAATMRQAAADVADGARRTRSSTAGAVAGVSGSARDLQSVAAAAEEMAGSINDIGQQIAHVTTAVRTAVDRVVATDAKVTGMSEAAERIGNVVHLITGIASQTNLLALNATIEAARAGEAGRGFAVVAVEVKALASQTARATEQVAAQILAIRDASGEAVGSMREVGTAISRVEEVATAIVAAVERQAAATREITSSVQTVSQATSGAAVAMDEVLTIAEGTNATSLTSLQAADEVGRTAETLHAEVSNFLNAMARGDDAEHSDARIPAHGSRRT